AGDRRWPVPALRSSVTPVTAHATTYNAEPAELAEHSQQKDSAGSVRSALYVVLDAAQCRRESSALFDVLTEHERDAVDVQHAEFADSIRPVCRRRCHRRAAIDNFSVEGVDILDPLEQVDATRTTFIFDEVDRGIV